MENLKVTLMPDSYWNETGVYQKELKELYKMVPREGSADSLHGELIRAISRLFYEYCNNGNCNACDCEYKTVEYDCSTCRGSGEMEEEEDEEGESKMCTCNDCCGSGVIEEEEEEDGDCAVNKYYAKFLLLICGADKSLEKVTSNVEDIITSKLYSSNDQFSDVRMNAYNELCDRVIFYVLNNDDKELPENYEIG